ncbi:MAG: hypothetical protein ABSG57_07720 [Candidatus Bathyarchaeia archaeon]
MSFEESQLMALNPPQFGTECVLCKFWRRVLPWQISANGDWGAVCPECGKSMLVRQLRSRLLGSFKKVELVEALLCFGVNKREAELLIGDLMKESILETAAGLFWEGSSEVVESLGVAVRLRPRSRRRFRKKTGEEIFLRCVKLAREIRSREEPKPSGRVGKNQEDKIETVTFKEAAKIHERLRW